MLQTEISVIVDEGGDGGGVFGGYAQLCTERGVVVQHGRLANLAAGEIAGLVTQHFLEIVIVRHTNCW